MSYNYNNKQLDHKNIKFKWDLNHLNIINHEFFLLYIKIVLIIFKEGKFQMKKIIFYNYYLLVNIFIKYLFL